MHAWTGGNRRRNSVQRRDMVAQQRSYFARKREERLRQQVQQRGQAGSSRVQNPTNPAQLGALISERSRNNTRNRTNHRHVGRPKERKRKSELGDELSALGNLHEVDFVEGLLSQERPTKKRCKEKHKSKKTRKKERPSQTEPERTHVLNEETNTHTIYEDGEEKWRNQLKEREVERTQVIDAETDTMTVYENEKVVVASEISQAHRRKENDQSRYISKRPGGKRNRSPNAFSPRRRKNRSVLESYEPSRFEMEPKHSSLADTFAIHRTNAVDEPVMTPEIPSKEQAHRPKDPRLSLRISVRRRRESSEPASDPIQSPNWSSDGEPIRKPNSRRRIGKEKVLKWPNKDLSWMGPMKAEDFNPEIAAMESRLFTPDKTTGLFSFPPKRVSTPRRSMARLSPNAETVNSRTTQRRTSGKNSCEQKLLGKSGDKKSMVEISSKIQSVNKKGKDVEPIETRNLTLVDDLIIVEESE